jgi:type II secretory pathway component PulM
MQKKIQIQIILKWLTQIKNHDIVKQNLLILRNYWSKQTARDQMILMAVGVIIACALMFLIITGLITYTQNLRLTNQTLTTNLANVNYINAKLTQAQNTSSPNFSTVNKDKITNMVKTLANKENFQVGLDNNTLNISGNNFKFDAIIVLLSQLRTTYGLFPDDLTITRLSQSGYVTFNITFNNVNDE